MLVGQQLWLQWCYYSYIWCFPLSFIPTYMQLIIFPSQCLSVNNSSCSGITTVTSAFCCSYMANSIIFFPMLACQQVLFPVQQCSHGNYRNLINYNLGNHCKGQNEKYLEVHNPRVYNDKMAQRHTSKNKLSINSISQ